MIRNEFTGSEAASVPFKKMEMRKHISSIVLSVFCLQIPRYGQCLKICSVGPREKRLTEF